MFSSALSILHAFHRQLQQSALEGIKHFHAQTTPAIATYAKSFQDCLPANFKRVADQRLVEKALQSNIVLFGDFHTLPQSQVGFLELLRRTHHLATGRPIQVALEIFAAADQEHIDDYLSGRLPEEYFLKRIDYHNKWGFPWENYKPIVDFCVQNKLPILGINSQTRSGNRLAKRDTFAADILHTAQGRDPEALIFCLIGEYHLADQHLPQNLKGSRVVRVVNNIDDYSLPALNEQTSIQSFETIELNENFFCVLNTSPWLKWQSLAMWEELHGVSEESFYGGEIDAYTVQEYDFEYQLLFILKSMNHFLQLGISANDMSFDIYLKPDRTTLSYLRSKFGISRQDYATAERRLYQDGFCYLPRAKAILLLDYSMHYLLEAAGHILLDCVNKQLPRPSGFSQRVHYQVCGAICSLIMNPRRSIFTIDRVETELKVLQRKRLLGESRKYREAYRLVRDCHDDGFPTLLKSSSSLEERDKDCNFLVSRIFGETLAHRLFETLLSADSQAFKQGLVELFSGDLLAQLAVLNNTEQRFRSAS